MVATLDITWMDICLTLGIAFLGLWLAFFLLFDRK